MNCKSVSCHQDIFDGASILVWILSFNCAVISSGSKSCTFTECHWFQWDPDSEVLGICPCKSESWICASIQKLKELSLLLQPVYIFQSRPVVWFTLFNLCLLMTEKKRVKLRQNIQRGEVELASFLQKKVLCFSLLNHFFQTFMP